MTSSSARGAAWWAGRTRARGSRGAAANSKHAAVDGSGSGYHPASASAQATHAQRLQCTRHGRTLVPCRRDLLARFFEALQFFVQPQNLRRNAGFVLRPLCVHLCFQDAHPEWGEAWRSARSVKDPQGPRPAAVFLAAVIGTACLAEVRIASVTTQILSCVWTRGGPVRNAPAARRVGGAGVHRLGQHDRVGCCLGALGPASTPGLAAPSAPGRA